MERLSAFELNNSRKLFELAKKLQDKKFFETFLNEAQFKILKHIIDLDNFDVWYNFLEGNCYEEESKGEKSETGTNQNDNNELLFEEGSKMIKMLALHIRYLLWEKAIDFYYVSKDLDRSVHDIEEVTDDYELIDSLDNVPEDEEQNKPEEASQPSKPVVREEEDEYDDEDDDDEEVQKEKESQHENKDGSEKNELVLVFNDDKQIVLEVPLSILKLQEANPEEELTNELSEPAPVPVLNRPTTSNEEHDALIKEFNKVYHNFEYDRETLIKRRKLERSDLQLENSKDTDDQESNLNGSSSDTPGAANNSSSSMGINLGAASTSLQHLLSTIQQQRDNVPLNDHELRTLFMDVRKNRGKWANDDRVGQEELYEACEKVVLELRGYTEHSTPFLNKVSKREAPNYGLIIKKPMDLNTVMKKLKSLAYSSKQEFLDDVMLIWSNCLTYNADPKHFIRAHALAMQKKTMKLAPSIPNITVRNRADIELEEDEAEARPATPLEPGFGGGKAVKKGRKRTRQDQVKTETDPNSPISTAVSAIASPEVKVAASETPAVENGNLSNDEEEEEEEEAENINGEADGIQEEEEEDEFDPELQAWRALTAKSRANYCAQRSELFDENYHLRPNARAIIRKPAEMQNFNEYLTNKEVVSKSNNLLENEEPYLLEYDITGGIPGFEYKGVDKEEEEKREEKLVDIYLQQAHGDASKIKSGFVLPTDSGLNKLYFENITEMQEIKKICFKISLIRQMQTQQFVHHTQMKQPEIETLKEVDVDSASKLPNHEINEEDIQFAVLRRNVAKIAMQTGFESTQPNAINTLTQIAERYLGNLVKSLKMHNESNSSNKLTSREILLMSLLENGVDKPDDLYTYVQERIVKQQDKLKDLRIKLSNFLKELLRPGLENFNERSFEDNSEQFMTGDFSSDLGDDFFGFKQLGLDKEFNMLSTSIPIYLLHSRLHNSYSSTGVASKGNKFEDLNDFKPEDLYASTVDQQIGLLVPFYRRLCEKSKAHFIKMQKKKGESTELPPNDALIMIEDEELPQKQRNIRPRLPPTGKISSVKKKIVANSFFLPEETDSNSEISQPLKSEQLYSMKAEDSKSSVSSKSPKKLLVKMEA
ncbi:uncharacterized protein CANTADRAFT_49602 [Suhomyces tanzawaensis NRRL Y-17324]|uniref:SAGA complex subunit Spt7 n=1 Tax=Suhomyces tanzawaensis NRRL Y-17324 TaxID=984487 RepID=A0A1E4SJD3_9ASCO|nr:uncharacterized protein CANTADRAFT_49602 [Suhomyces tanzawaensis NRRL Y-17324]ODV79611.1 hypothetical protein CANTADRAFT_49602 [Suhomyces tanzawaensis NRRL Y-17324]